MKKLLLTLLLCGFSAGILNAQTPAGVSVPLVTYKVATTGYSNGLQIVSPFYISVNSLTAEIDTAAGFMLMSHTMTTTDSSLTNVVVNDSIPPFKIYSVTIAEVDTMTLDGMIESRIKQNLIDVYGVGNISKVGE